jgi:hypothetical protein
VGQPPSDRKAVLLLSSLGGFIGALCCLAPIILVLFGLASVSAAASLGNVLYGDYAWAFRAAALLFLAAGLVFYFRKRGICSLDDAKRHRTQLLNVTFLVLLTSTSIYVFWNYVVLHYWGIAAGLPWAQWDESWAIPWSAGLLTASAAAIFLFLRNSKN